MICLDIPMPENCGECRLMADGWCRVLQGDSHLNRYAADMDKRPEWCPIKEIIQCVDCKHFELDSWANVNGMPLIVAHEICNRWGRGCKTEQTGFCFLGREEVKNDK